MTFPESIGFDDAWGEELPPAFFARSPLDVARAVIGALLVSSVGGQLTAGRIVESEAYLGADDAGSHAATSGVTRRNSVMYGLPGTVYVYFTYGTHHMLNLVCEPEGTAGAVLIRALEPLAGVAVMRERRHGRRELELCRGPGKLAQALGVDLSDNASRLGSGRLAVYAGNRSQQTEIGVSGRVGLRKGHDLPYRFFECGSRYVSGGRTRPARTQVGTTGRGRNES
jgi:DNA-3-methyladenine glycosylase